ncbi:threonine ammonia-lyase [Carboxydocella sp. JDF658]|nr:threonine ammonia-lyase [Carboxydocella sp. JDF658]GAW32885.1 threonine ammonia-lyase [Carboxydocella sp. JDF658]
MAIVDLTMIEQAAVRLQGVAHRTPLDLSTTFSRLSGREVWLKHENLQKTGSFKLRGAYNRILTLSPEDKAKGVIAASAGNHAQGVAYGASAAGIPATIVMPEGAPLSKVSATRSYGARVVLSGISYDEAYQKAKEIQEQTGATFVHAFDDPEVIAGQGTIGLEILEEIEPEVVVAPIGGGGLVAGLATAIKGRNPRIKVIGIQAAGAPAMYLSKRAGSWQEIIQVDTIADGIAVKKPGQLTFQIINDLVDEIVTVTDEEIAQAILMLLERGKTIVEGAGAVGVAALLAGKLPFSGRTAIVLSGGNIDVNMVATIINRGLSKAGRRLRFRTILVDKPGSLQKLLELIARTRANVISITHDRTRPTLTYTQAEVILELETQDNQHIGEILAILQNNHYQVEIVS